MNRDEPEIALDYLKKVRDNLIKFEKHSLSSSISIPHDHKNMKTNIGSITPSNIIDSNFKVCLYYNLACCY